jgi:hypothetical protein
MPETEDSGRKKTNHAKFTRYEPTFANCATFATSSHGPKGQATRSAGVEKPYARSYRDLTRGTDRIRS